MYKGRFAIGVLAAGLLLGGLRPSPAAAVGTAVPQITLVGTLAYPGTGTTNASGINNFKDIVGQFIPTTGDSFGFEFVPHRTFNRVAFPGAVSTFAYSINDSGEIAGGWQDATTLNSAGFFLQNGVYTSFSQGTICANNLPCPTTIIGLNNRGDFVGTWAADGSTNKAFIDVGGVFTSVIVPPAPGASDINSIDNKSVRAVGDYQDSSGNFQSFVFTVATKSFASAAYPGATATELFGINLSGALSGRETDAAGTHAAVRACGGQWATYDYPGATSTSAERINDAGFMTGRYTDSGGASHAIRLRVRCVPPA